MRRAQADEGAQGTGDLVRRHPNAHRPPAAGTSPRRGRRTRRADAGTGRGTPAAHGRFWRAARLSLGRQVTGQDAGRAGQPEQGDGQPGRSAFVGGRRVEPGDRARPERREAVVPVSRTASSAGGRSSPIGRPRPSGPGSRFRAAVSSRRMAWKASMLQGFLVRRSITAAPSPPPAAATAQQRLRAAADDGGQPREGIDAAVEAEEALQHRGEEVEAGGR